MVNVYLLQSDIDATFYTGIAKDVQLRLQEHNRGAVIATRKKRPWKIVYRKEHSNYVLARKHEKWLKKKNRAYKNKLAGQAVTNYMDDLEREGMVVQKGETSQTYYELA